MLKPETKLNKEHKKWIQVLSSLTFREMDFLINRYILGYNLSELGSKYKLDRERIRQIENGALTKITLHSSLAKKFSTYKREKETIKKEIDI